MSDILPIGYTFTRILPPVTGDADGHWAAYRLVVADHVPSLPYGPQRPDVVELVTLTRCVDVERLEQDDPRVLKWRQDHPEWREHED